MLRQMSFAASPFPRKSFRLGRHPRPAGERAFREGAAFAQSTFFAWSARQRQKPLVGALAAECAADGGLGVLYIVAGDFKEPVLAHAGHQKLAADEAALVPPSLMDEAQDCDLLILEDFRQLPLPAAESVVRIIDHRHAHRAADDIHRQRRSKTSRLSRRPFYRAAASRLQAGLTIAVEALKSPPKDYLEEIVQRRG